MTILQRLVILLSSAIVVSPFSLPHNAGIVRTINQSDNAWDLITSSSFVTFVIHPCGTHGFCNKWGAYRLPRIINIQLSHNQRRLCNGNVGSGEKKRRMGRYSSTSNALKLENPLKVQRNQIKVDRNVGRDYRERRRGDKGDIDTRSNVSGYCGMRRKVKIGPSPLTGMVGGNEDVNVPESRGYSDKGYVKTWDKNDKGPRHGFVGQNKNNRNYEKKPRSSCCLGTILKKGRSNENNARRVVLKERDRSKQMKEEAALFRRTVILPVGAVIVSDLAELMGEKPINVLKYLMTNLGVMASVTQSLDSTTCAAVVRGFGKVVYRGEEKAYNDVNEENESKETVLDVGYALVNDDSDCLVPRPPVVTIMGHVDHGKTTLIDALRDSKVIAGEAGGITQHIGVYQIEQSGEKITLIDTPGHAAFIDMRQRGANITDIVILVVAADDGVKQQTADSIACARQAGVPLIVAINKIDIETADVNRVKSDLTGYDVLTEDLGGDVLCCEISAKKRINLHDLLEKILLQTEIQGLKANPNRKAQGTIIEARVEKGLGSVATTLIQKGTINVGDVFVAGSTFGRVKALIALDNKTRLNEARPSTPISVVGFDGTPSAGDLLVVCDNEKNARDLACSRSRIAREKEAASYQKDLLQCIAASFNTGAYFKEHKKMCVVVKADVQGSAEALSRSLHGLKMENEEALVTINVLVSKAGEVTKSDVYIASVTSGTIIIAFNCFANAAAVEDARQLGIPIEYYNIVYDAIESVESRMHEVLSPTPDGEYVGGAIVQEVFNISGVGNIAGSRCQDGYIKKGSNVRVMRGDKILCRSKIRSLRNFKTEVDIIEASVECGVSLTDFDDFQHGDVIESFVVK